MKEVKGIEIPEICAKCGGKCCKYYPGGATPEDFGAPDERLMYNRIKEALKSGRWVLDWEGVGESRVYFLRPATKGNEYRVFDHSYEGECTFLTPTGCELRFQERPETCRMLIPREDKPCDHQGYTRRYVSNLWKQYQTIVMECAVDVEEIEWSEF